MEEETKTWLIIGLIIIIFKLILLIVCICRRARLRNEQRRRLINEEDEIHRNGQMTLSVINNNQLVTSSPISQMEEFEHVQNFEPPGYSQRQFERPPSYWDSVNNENNNVRPYIYTTSNSNQ